MDIPLLALLILSGMGLLFFISVIIMMLSAKRKAKRCYSETLGTIIKYSYLNGAFAPIAEYYVDGRVYKIKRKFNAIIKTQKFGKLYSDEDAYVSERDFLHIKTGAVTNFKSMAEDLYPLGSMLTVYYNPKRPRDAFLEKPPQIFSFVSIFFMGTGIFCVLIGILMYFVLQVQ